MMDTLSGFIQCAVCPEPITTECVVTALWHTWIRCFGAPGRLTADNDRRWRDSSGLWSSFLNLYGIEMHLTSPYQSSTNGRCERRVQELRKELRIVVTEFPDLAWPDTLCLATCLVNAQPRAFSGKSALDMFLPGKSQWPDNFSSLVGLPEGSLLSNVQKATERLRETMARDRAYRHTRKVRYQPDTKVVPGVYVYVHKRRFPSAERGLSLWLGPYLVNASSGREAEVLVNGKTFRVHHSMLKVAPDGEVPSSRAMPTLPEMTPEEMADEGYFVAEAVLDHARTRRGWEVHVRWSDGSFTWEPVRNLIQELRAGGLRCSEALREYLHTHDSPDFAAHIASLLGSSIFVVGSNQTVAHGEPKNMAQAGVLQVAMLEPEILHETAVKRTSRARSKGPGPPSL